MRCVVTMSQQGTDLKHSLIKKVALQSSQAQLFFLSNGGNESVEGTGFAFKEVQGEKEKNIIEIYC